MEDQKDDDLTIMQQKLLNGVAYESLPETSIAVSRTFKKNYFQKDSYTSSNNEAICDINTGAEFINPRRSYLTFGVTCSGDANFGHGGATNLIKRVVITSRSGTEISRTEEYNTLTCKAYRYGCSRSSVQQFGQLMGFTDVAAEQKSDHAQLSTTRKQFVIPLTMLSPFFSGDGKALIPPQLAAGLRVQLTFESDARALVAAAARTYTIDQISIVTNVTTMIDSWQKQINEESARDGLTYSFPEWHTTQSNSGAGTRLNVEVRKAVARAMMAFTVTQSKANVITDDNMKSDAYSATSVQYRLGSLYPTQQPITTVQEGYFLAQSAFDADVLDCKRTNDVSLTSFSDSTAASTGAADGDSVCAVSLERNDVAINGVLNIGGLPTNNSRVLAVDIDGVAAASTTYLFMKHLRVVKAFVDNVSVSE
tara:strand:+ start:348 stop:1616 length:1269 start_codon:yes stop_codon:yes gene_type:complete